MKRQLSIFSGLVLCLLSAAQPRQAFKGWPGHDDISDLKECFSNPPKGYGNVPFYWWSGDPLDMERLTEQLELLSDASTDGLCVSYNHTHDKVDFEINAQGHGNCGRVSGGSPRVMSDGWWDIWNRFSALCADRGIGLGMDDYVLAWPGNGDHMDSVILSDGIREYRGRLVRAKLPAGAAAPEHILWKEEAYDSTVYIYTETSPWLHPDIGKVLIAKYFDKFTEHLDSAGLKGMNYFFQDELQYGLTPLSWSEDMPQQFLARKGYDIVPLLDRLFISDPAMIDAEAARVRLDYDEVLTQLAEERFFRPIYEWNASRGLIYGCDNEGRGLRPLQYVDYFRAISWFTAPGNDAPSRGSSFRQTKVSSSIAHLYGRPRTWLEAFHSIGWDANGALLKHQLDHHIIAGGNLLCMHGLYYSTHGLWWEWAPPCFHFRMPYWPHMKLWLKYAERMCFLLSQGTHVCDIAILYPTETMQAIPGTDAKSTFAVSDSLSIHGLDYDFIDYQSIQKASVLDGCLQAGSEKYRVLVLADTRALHRETLDRILEFRRLGGIVVAAGYVMPELRDAGVVAIPDASAVADTVRSLAGCDFATSSGRGRVLHRHIGERDVYMVMDVNPGDTMFFRARGFVEKWDAASGSSAPLGVVSVREDGTLVRYDGDAGGSVLVVFSPGEAVVAANEEIVGTARVQPLSGEWNVEIIPTMNNRWGDFRLPAFDGKIGVEARRMDGQLQGYGPFMQTCNIESTTDLAEFIASGMQEASWEPYCWSWQYGVEDSPGPQGWHGLKAKVDSRFLILDKGCHQLFRTMVYAPRNGNYRIVTEGVAPDYALYDGEPCDSVIIHLKKGWHSMLLAYASTPFKAYDLMKKRGSFNDGRQRSMVMLYPATSEIPAPHGMFDSIVASRWFGTDYLVFDPAPSSCRRSYRFSTAPGTAEMTFKVNGRVKKVLLDGKPAPFSITPSGEVRITPGRISPSVSSVELVGVPDRGCPGSSFFATPVAMSCRGGKMNEGDWTAFGAMEFYSGGVRYSRDIDVEEHHSRVELDLGEVDATCEVTVNGAPVGALISSPYKIDITDYVHTGKNNVEVLVYSTLSNHYSTTPSPYRGTPHAGLIGPVSLRYL